MDDNDYAEWLRAEANDRSQQCFEGDAGILRDIATRLTTLTAENKLLREALEDALPTMNCKMFETIHAKFVKALGKGE